MHRAALDTKVIVSGTATTSTIPYLILESWRSGDYVLVTSPQILAEVRETFLKPKIRKFTKLSPGQIDRLVAEIGKRAFVVAGILELDVVRDDPDDNKFIACAVEGSASHVVPGDKHLLDVGEYEGIEIVRPKFFLEACLLREDENHP